MTALQGDFMSNTILQPGFLMWDGTKYVLVPSVPVSGAAGGDLSGSYPNPSVSKITGITISGAPTTGQVLTATSVSAANWQTPTAIVSVQQNGVPTSSEPNLNFINAQVFDDATHHAVTILNTPGIVAINNSTPGTLTNTLTVGECDTSTGTCSVTFPALGSSIFNGLILSVYDIANNAGSNAVTVHPSGGTQIEDPANPGTFSSSPINITVSSFSVTWILSSNLNHWKIMARFPDSSF